MHVLNLDGTTRDVQEGVGETSSQVLQVLLIIFMWLRPIATRAQTLLLTRVGHEESHQQHPTPCHRCLHAQFIHAASARVFTVPC